MHPKILRTKIRLRFTNKAPDAQHRKIRGNEVCDVLEEHDESLQTTTLNSRNVDVVFRDFKLFAFTWLNGSEAILHFIRVETKL